MIAQLAQSWAPAHCSEACCGMGESLRSIPLRRSGAQFLPGVD